MEAQIIVKNKGTDAISYDGKAVALKRTAIENDYKALKKNFDNVAAAYQKLYKNPKTKGEYKTILHKLCKTSNSRAKYANNAVTNFRNKLNSGTQAFVSQQFRNELESLKKENESIKAVLKQHGWL